MSMSKIKSAFRNYWMFSVLIMLNVTFGSVNYMLIEGYP